MITCATMRLSFTGYMIDLEEVQRLANNIAQQLAAQGKGCDTISVKVRHERGPEER